MNERRTLQDMTIEEQIDFWNDLEDEWAKRYEDESKHLRYVRGCAQEGQKRLRELL